MVAFSTAYFSLCRACWCFNASFTHPNYYENQAHVGRAFTYFFKLTKKVYMARPSVEILLVSSIPFRVGGCGSVESLWPETASLFKAGIMQSVETTSMHSAQLIFHSAVHAGVSMRHLRIPIIMKIGPMLAGHSLTSSNWLKRSIWQDRQLKFFLFPRLPGYRMVPCSTCSQQGDQKYYSELTELW